MRGGQAIENGTSLSVALGDLDSDGDVDAFVGTGNSEFGQAQADRIWFNQPMPGDTFPYDGKIDLEDLNRVRNQFGAVSPTGGAIAGDSYPFDGRVDLRDLNAVRNHFGAVVALSSAESAAPATVFAGKHSPAAQEFAVRDYLFGTITQGLTENQGPFLARQIRKPHRK